MFEFDWDEANMGHIARHDVTREEAEQTCLSDTVTLEDYDLDGEERFVDLGETASGRILKVVTTQRGDKLRVVTAYDAGKPDKVLFLRSRMIQ